jgi:hypothetical protein
MILVRERRAEKRHEPVAEELVHRALVAVHFAERGLEEPAEQDVHAVRAEPLGESGGADEIAEEHGDGLALALHGATRGEDLLGEMARGVALGGGSHVRRGGCLDRAPAARAEPRAVGELGSAGRALCAETAPAADAEPGAHRILVLAARTSRAGANRHAGIMAFLPTGRLPSGSSPDASVQPIVAPRARALEKFPRFTRA